MLNSETFTKVDDEYNLYTNSDLKISLKYPISVNYKVNSCGSFSGILNSPVNVENLDKSNLIVIYPSKFEYIKEDGNSCEIKELTSWDSRVFNSKNWGIKLTTHSFKNIKELEKIINNNKENSNCKVKEIAYDSVYKYKTAILEEPVNGQTMGDCVAWGGRFNIKVNEEENRVILESEPRQQSRIVNWEPAEKYKEYDDEIFKSIQFLK